MRRLQACAIKTSAFGVEVAGELDMSVTDAFRSALSEVVERGDRDVVVDLTYTTLIDSMAIGVLAGRLKHLRAEGRTLTIRCSNPLVLETFRLSGAGDWLTILPGHAP